MLKDKNEGTAKASKKMRLKVTGIIPETM